MTRPGTTTLILQLLSVVEPHYSAKAVARAITARATGDVGYFSFASKLPEADGVFIDTRELLRLWAGPRRVFLVVRRSPAQSVVAALPPAGVAARPLCRRAHRVIVWGEHLDGQIGGASKKSVGKSPSGEPMEAARPCTNAARTCRRSQAELPRPFRRFASLFDGGNPDMLIIGMARTATIQVRGRGTVTLPAPLRAKYRLDEGDPLTLVDLDGAVLLSPRLLAVPRLAAEMERLRRARKLSLKDLGGPARED